MCTQPRIIAISHGCTGVAARACGLVGLEPTRFCDCRAVDVVNALPTPHGGTMELLYMQLYAPTTLAPDRDFWLLHYNSVLEDGSLVVCERSLSSTQGGPSMHQYSIFHPVPEVLRPLYESSTVLAQKTTMAALRQLRQISLEVSQSTVTGWGRKPAALRALIQRHI
ncbi:hypothetical protein C5167_026793 [Papaver somniferum]|nr:hypothetical protein C5167_026793 [Papaver somniferum]